LWHKTADAVNATPLMTPTTDLGLSTRVSVFELRETGDWDVFFFGLLFTMFVRSHTLTLVFFLGLLFFLSDSCSRTRNFFSPEIGQRISVAFVDPRQPLSGLKTPKQN